ncbi:hypothetical protein V499_07610 [Pseudogymnoascus sp. VKM F-103]|nr:hypothetical protein V499_07610 [Pseudogymnoascus sp. VKM F-103]
MTITALVASNKHAKIAGVLHTVSIQHCRRLSLACQRDRASKSTLDISNNTENSAGSDIDRETSVNNDGLLERVGKIESQLDKLANTLNALLPAIVSQANSDQTVTSWRSDPHNAGIRDELASPARTTMDTSDVQASKYQALPPPRVMSSVVDIYFNRVQNQPYSFFHENNFRQRLRDDMLPDHLKFAVLATALRFSDDEYYNGEYLEATAAYARKSWTLLVEHWFAAEIDPDIYICQSVTLLAIIDFTAGRRHPGWLKIGMAVRIAQDLCLMMEPDSSLSYADQEERRRVFWSIYLLDKFCSCGRTRAAAITDAQCRVQLPCDEATFENGEWKKTPTLDELLSTVDALGIASTTEEKERFNYLHGTRSQISPNSTQCFFSLFLNDADSNIRQQAINGLQTNTAFLEELSRHWKNGKVMASLLQDLATESISSALLAASAAQPENLDAKILQNLWASVDTTTLSQPLKPITSSIGCDTPSTGFNSLLELDARDLSNFDINGLSPDPVSHLDMQSPNPSLALDGMSPFTSFFTGGSMNFGG